MKITNSQFTVFRLELKQQAFENSIADIDKLSLQKDYIVHKESVWKCIRTERPVTISLFISSSRSVK